MPTPSLMRMTSSKESAGISTLGSTASFSFVAVPGIAAGISAAGITGSGSGSSPSASVGTAGGFAGSFAGSSAGTAGGSAGDPSSAWLPSVFSVACSSSEVCATAPSSFSVSGAAASVEVSPELRPVKSSPVTASGSARTSMVPSTTRPSVFCTVKVVLPAATPKKHLLSGS